MPDLEPEASESPESLEPSAPVVPEPPPPLGFRLRWILLSPAAAFRRLDGRWGWAKPWLLVSAFALLYGLMVLSRIDLVAYTEDVLERSLSGAQRELIEESRGADAMEQMRRFGVFTQKVSLLVLPPLRGLIYFLCLGGLIYLVTRACEEKGSIRLMDCFSLVSHAALTEVPRYCVLSVAVLISGGYAMHTGPAAFVDPYGGPLLAALLVRFDLFTLLFYGYLAVGLESALYWSRARALGFACLVWVLLGLPGLLSAILQGITT